MPSLNGKVARLEAVAEAQAAERLAQAEASGDYSQLTVPELNEVLSRKLEELDRRQPGTVEKFVAAMVRDGFTIPDDVVIGNAAWDEWLQPREVQGES